MGPPAAHAPQEEEEGLRHASKGEAQAGGEVVMLSSTLAEEDEDAEAHAYAAYDSTGASH
jgi:hypothetical protein